MEEEAAIRGITLQCATVEDSGADKTCVDPPEGTSETSKSYDMPQTRSCTLCCSPTSEDRAPPSRPLTSLSLVPEESSVSGAAVSTTDLPPLEDYLEKNQALQRQNQAMIANVVEAVSREVKRSIEACMHRMESKLMDNVREAGAQVVVDSVGKLIPGLVEVISSGDETAMSSKINMLGSILQQAFEHSNGSMTTSGCNMMASHSVGSSSCGRDRRRSGVPKGYCSPTYNISERSVSVKTLERELAGQQLEDRGFRHLARKESRTPSSASSASPSPHPRSSETSRSPSLVQVVPSALAAASTAAAAAAAASTEVVPVSLGRKLVDVIQRQGRPAFDRATLRVQHPNTLGDVESSPRVDSAEPHQEGGMLTDETLPSCEDMMMTASSVSRSCARQHSTRMTTAEVLRLRVHELTERIPADTGTSYVKAGAAPEDDSNCAGSYPSIPIALRVCGIFPWTRAWPIASSSYQILVWLATLAACVWIIMHVAFAFVGTQGHVSPDFVFTNPTYWSNPRPMSQLPLAFGATFSLAVLSRLGCRDSLADDVVILQAYAFQQEFSAQWERRVRFDKWLIFFVWLLATAAQCSAAPSYGLEFPSLTRAAHTFAFAIASGILLWLVFFMLYVCRALALMVDTFCSRVVDSPDLPTTLDEWNVLQAVLRKTSAAIEHCFVILQLVMVFTMPLLLADLYMLGANHGTIAGLLPSICVLCGVLRTFTLAASITDKCTRVPALINTLSFGQGTDRDRQHTVDYIVSSAAGFYVCDVRLNMAMAFKFMYGWSVIAFGLMTNVFANN